MSATSASVMPSAAAVGGASGSGGGVASSQSGPPYLCPTCGTNYSRLEYLRRHERRHADIRPFVCDCGKGFSRSDVLSRHKRQCAVVLNGGEEGGISGDISVASNKSANGKRAGAANVRRKSSNTGRGNAGARNSRKGSRSDSLQDTPEDDDDDDEAELGGGGGAADMHNAHHRQHRNSNADQRSAPVIRPGASLQQAQISGSTGSFPFPPQPGVHQAQGGPPPPLLPPAPYGSDLGLLGNAGPGAQPGHPGNQGFGNVLPHHMTAFGNLVNQQHNYPSSPESNGTMSQHSSPRFGARDMSRHGSTGSRTYSLRKGGSFDHIGPRNGGAIPGTTPNQYAPEFWDALDPAAKNVSSMAGSDYISAGAAIGMGDTSNSVAGLSGGALGGGGVGLNGGVTTPRGGDHQRFAVSTGPLSPFSSIALTSTMSPYLSAFSNARDTPFVASPSRGLIPGTPGSSLNVFDWTMRPPSKPASSSMAKRDSTSQQNGGPGANGGAAAPSSSAQPGSSTTSPAGNKRKRDEDEGSRKSPRMDDMNDVAAAAHHLDDEHRSAAELLDSLRNSGHRNPQTPGATDASTISSSAPSISAPVPASIELSADALAAVSAAADVAAITAVSQGISLPGTTAPASVSTGARNDADARTDGEQQKIAMQNLLSDKTKMTNAPQQSNSNDLPPAHNLTLSQLPVSMQPNSDALYAQSGGGGGWEAIMQGNGHDRWGGPQTPLDGDEGNVTNQSGHHTADDGNTK